MNVINSYYIGNKLIKHTKGKSAFTLGKGCKKGHGDDDDDDNDDDDI